MSSYFTYLHNGLYKVRKEYMHTIMSAMWIVLNDLVDLFERVRGREVTGRMNEELKRQTRQILARFAMSRIEIQQLKVKLEEAETKYRDVLQCAAHLNINQEPFFASLATKSVKDKFSVIHFASDMSQIANAIEQSIYEIIEDKNLQGRQIAGLVWMKAQNYKEDVRLTFNEYHNQIMLTHGEPTRQHEPRTVYRL
ncbi:uncharacterized protein LOC129795096 [Lutzomyia longipalpis]|uniref:uncharacterized protein LOC129795096 n=1 Tax=Lutzomyia longipalpis TaxID=7200 RepID=UPI00248375DA|nr:uncharacterized protein LOC129795096 [Lutzomyia longipalpis]